MPPVSSQPNGYGSQPLLPPGYISLGDVAQETARVASMVNVAGLVKDYRLPMATTGKDFKSELILSDVSTQYSSHGVSLTIFGPEGGMPQVSAGDVVLATQVKVQRFRNNPMSLITNFMSDIHVYSASKIPKPPMTAKEALMPTKRKIKRELKDRDHEYVSWLYHEVDKDQLPTAAEFEVRISQSKNVKDKFTLLKDVTEGKFSDLIVRVVRDPFSSDDRITVYASDYTENPRFFHYAWEGPTDPYGYTANSASESVKWVGPYGKKTLQITCYEPHASFIHNEVKAGAWLFLRNVQIKYGRSSTHLEGFLREDRGANTAKLNVDIMEASDPETLDPRLKEAIRRWRDYEKTQKAQIKDFKSGGTGTKRKADIEEKPNAKTRRKKKRSKKFEEEKLNVEASADLNGLIKCENSDRPLSLISSILELVHYDTRIDSQEVRLAIPFTCAKYRATVRVTDFYPSRLEDFACARRPVVFEVLSDYSGADSSSSGDDDSACTPAGRQPGSDLIWEWRFALQIEDASPKAKQPPGRIWIAVDNLEAQCLTGLDASDLRVNTSTLASLREKLFTLWGDLEEHKASRVARAEQLRSRRPGDKPPLEDSDGEEGAVENTAAPLESKISNKPFTCCIRQYGVVVDEADPWRADAGDGKRWERVFGLFGTKIC